jgi:hypothetical protein
VLASGVVSSSLTSIGTLTGLNVSSIDSIDISGGTDGSGQVSLHSASSDDNSVRVFSSGGGVYIAAASGKPIDLVTAGAGTIRLTGDTVPNTDSAHDLGLTGTRWANIYGDSLYGTIQTAAQANITSVGTLSSLTVTGNIGSGRSPITDLDVYRVSENVNLLLETDVVNGTATVSLKNDIELWELSVNSSDQFELYTGVGGTYPFIIESATPTNALYLQADGHIGFGRVPTNDFDFYRASENIVLLIETGVVNGSAVLELKNDAQSWKFVTNTTDEFSIFDNTNSKTPFLIEPSAPTNSQYIDADGHVGWGRDPTTDFDFYRVSEAAVLLIESGANAEARVDIKNTVGHWASIITSTTGQYFIKDITNTLFPFTIEPGTPSNTLYLDSDGGVLMHTSTSLHPTLDTIESFGAWALIGRDTNVNENIKETSFGLTHYLSATQAPFAGIRLYMNSAASIVTIGGGTTIGNAATSIRFNIAADTTTLIGTELARFENTLGALLIKRTSVITGLGAGSILQIDGDFSLRGSSDGDRRIILASDASILWDESENELVFTKNLKLNNIRLFDKDPGVRTAMDFSVQSAGMGTEQSYSFKVQSTPLLKMYCESDGFGGVQNLRALFNYCDVGINGTPNEALTIGSDGVLSIDERAAPPSNTTGYGKIWIKNTAPSELWYTDDAGTSTKIM